MTLRMTKQRTIILQELQRNRQHLSADELYERVRKIIPRVSLATIYRNLEILTEHGKVKQLEVAGTRKIYDGDVEPHSHIFCLSCNMVENIDLSLPDNIFDVQDSDYQITGYRLNVVGLCQKCKLQKNKK